MAPCSDAQTANRPKSEQDIPLIQLIPASASRVLVAAERPTVLAFAANHAAAEKWGIVKTAEDIAAVHRTLHQAIPCDWSRHLPDLPINYFDCVAGEHLLEVTDHPLRILNRLACAIREGGVLILSVFNQQYHRCATSLISGNWIPAGSDVISNPGPTRFYTAASLASLVQRCPMLYLEACAPLEKDPPEAFPIDAEGFFQKGNLRVGPLSPAEYTQWLTRRYVLVCSRNGVPPKLRD
ncbi:MAG TPA: hypothetical protein PLO53_12975 [Candidatus Hydrogenedentes bacterium]|nr:hypothetical protein [Candidatus Hydrogenedentota bacterium]